MQDEIEIRIDKRTELLGVLFYLSEYRRSNPKLINTFGESNEYINKVNRFFSNHICHNCITVLNILINSMDFAYDAPVNLFLQFEGNCSSFKLCKYPYETRLLKSSLVPKLMINAIDFYNKSNFEAFYSSNSEFYNSLITSAKTLINQGQIIDFIKRLYGSSWLGQNDLCFDIMPSTSGGSYGFKIDNTVYCVSGLYKGSLYINTQTCLHEFLHPIINPLTEKYLSYDNLQNKKLFSDSMYTCMRRLAYPSNDIIINEHMIRAIQAAFAFITDGEVAMENQILRDGSYGFMHLKHLKNRFIEHYSCPNMDFEKAYNIILDDFLDSLPH